MKKIFFVLVILLPASMAAQTKADTTKLADSIKFEIIKSTVEFLSSDRAGVEATPTASKCVNRNYDCLISYCEALSNVKNGRNFVTDWKSKTVNSGISLDSFKVQIIRAVTQGNGAGYDKSVRTSFKNYQAYQQKVRNAKLVFPGKQPVPTEISSSHPETPVNPTAILREGKPTDNDPTTNESSIIHMIALILSLIAIAGAIYLYITFTKKHYKASSSNVKRKSEIEGLQSRLGQRVTELENSTKVKELELKIKELEERVVALSAKKAAGNEVRIPAEDPRLTARSKLEKPVEETKTVYAKLPDMENGFSSNILSDKQNGEQIFQIQAKGAAATFIVSNDPKAQTYALSDTNRYLPNACIFSNEPFAGCRIDTKAYGKLAKMGNDWIIKEKATVEFV